MELAETDLIEEIKGGSVSSDGRHIALKVRMDGQERFLALPQHQAMDLVNLITAAYDPSSTVGALLRPGNPQKSAVFDPTWSKT
jgi:hypothetical protein